MRKIIVKKLEIKYEQATDKGFPKPDDYWAFHIAKSLTRYGEAVRWMDFNKHTGNYEVIVG